MILVIYQLIAISLIILISKNEYQKYEVMLYPLYYQTYIKALFLQIFLILNAMFVLFLALDHDQDFMKPLISFFGRQKVFVHKYLFFFMHIIIFFSFIIMIYILIPKLMIGVDIQIEVFMFIDLLMDMFLILNLILIFIKDKYKTLAILIVLIYMLMTLFMPYDKLWLYYIFPIFRIDKDINMIEIYYKLCYISLGFSIYFLKFLKEAL
ncbi:hypothetical protein [Mariniplasma anaerobium]|uniref:Uncharacterized protein n=1 Tax=Mariniplasma anaerobium TaxID=2735436 RepID=A0A7U9TMD5_9MOLU|nr:hypothetical protein [Mariniplasma anaerobium]BCR36032.1 hypothetical protein MPAN_009250 [Mariniplasma anaerobium]